MRSSKGVTIIGLAITVVILGTLALVALNSGLGEGSMLQKTASGAKDWSEKEIIDEVNVLLADYAVDAAISENDTMNSYLLELLGANLIQDYRYIGKYLVMYKDVYCELEKDGFGYHVSKVREAGDTSGDEYVIITSEIIESNHIDIEEDKKYILLDDTEAQDFNFDIPANKETTIILAKDMTIDNKDVDRSAINLNDNSTLNLYIYGYIEVNSGYGKNAEGNNPGVGGYAGINVPETATLNLYGEGTLIARGGNAGNGGTVTSGTMDQKVSGAGGGGAGAGIGGSGGSGGVYKTGVGATGGTGKSCGKVNIYGNLTVYAYGGAGGAGGRGDHDTRTAGGGGGYPAAGIGGGGAGGAGGTCCAGAGGYSGGSGDMDHMIAHNGFAGGNGMFEPGITFLGGGGYFQGAEGISKNGSINRAVTTFGGFGNQGHWENLNDASGNGGIAGKGGTIEVSTNAKVYAYNGNRYTNGTSYNDGLNQCPIYLQNGVKITEYKYEPINKPMKNHFTLIVKNESSNLNIDRVNEFQYENEKLKYDRVTIANNSYLQNVEMKYQGVGSGAGFIEVSNGTYKKNAALNEIPEI